MSISSPVAAAPSAPPRGGLHVALWVVQVLLALAFFGAGATKLTQPLDQLVANGMTFVTYTPAAVVRFIGLAEVLGAIGLILPAATRLVPRLTGVAAAALTVVMVLAVGVHVTHGEIAGVGPAVFLGGLSAFVAWGRLARVVIPSRA